MLMTFTVGFLRPAPTRIFVAGRIRRKFERLEVGPRYESHPYILRFVAGH